jgi:GH25 family lysozyme M1 (1,4-beta-N-acetylmuramidase)
MCLQKDAMGRVVSEVPWLFTLVPGIFTPHHQFHEQPHSRTWERSRFSFAAAFILGFALLAGQWKALAQRPLGIDVSSFQGSADHPPTNIYWPAVKGAGITFTWAKATEGTFYVDADLAYNMANAKSAGVVIGAYHFAHPESDLGLAGADTEAAYFINHVAQYLKSGGAYLMPMLDYETAPGASYTKATSSQWVNEWCQDLVNYGQTNGLRIMPVVYTYTSFGTSYLDTSATNWPLWMASYPSNPNPQTGAPASTSPWTTWAFWQYSSSLTVSGVENAVDTDVFNGTAANLTNFVITTITNAPVFTTQPAANTTVTLGSNVTFTAAASGYPAPTYQWKFNTTNINGANSTSLTITNAQTNNAGVYSVVASNVAGVVTSSNATLTVYIPLTITTQPTNLTVLKGSTAAFSVAAMGTPPPGYQWQFNDVSIPGASSNVLTIPNVQSNKQGNYSVSVTNSTGSIISSNATLTVVTAPAITAQPTNRTVIEGNSTTFTVTATGTPTLTYQWLLGGSNIDGATGSSYSIGSVQAGQGGNYQVLVTNNYGAATSSNALLTVLSPPMITGQPHSVTVPAGSNATFTVTATGTGLTYQWLFNSGAIGGANGTSYTVVGAQTNNAGNYSVLVTNTVASVTSSNAVLTVSAQAPQFVSVTVTNGVVQMVLSGQTGAVYAIDGSSNLLDWVQLTTFTNTTGSYQFTDPSSTNNPLGFYRARSLP